MSDDQEQSPPVTIRAVEASDCQPFLALMHRSRNLHQPWIFPPQTEAAFDQYLRRTRQPDHQGYLVCHRDTGELLGVINLNNIVYGAFLSAYLGYYAGAPFAGRGFMRAGLELVKQQAFDQLGLHRLEANIQPTNVPSIRLVQACGFTREGMSPAYLFIDGKWRDHERWAVLDPRRGLRG